MSWRALPCISLSGQNVGKKSVPGIQSRSAAIRAVTTLRVKSGATVLLTTSVTPRERSGTIRTKTSKY